MKVSKTYRFKICFAVCSVFTLMVLPPLATADPITFDLMPGGDFGPEGNIGVSSSVTTDGLTLTLTAAFKIPRVSGDPYYDAGWGRMEAFSSASMAPEYNPIPERVRMAFWVRAEIRMRPLS